MQKDFHLNKDLQKEFQVFFERESNDLKSSLQTEMNATILAQGYWPFSITEEDSIIVPYEMKGLITIFERFLL